MRPSLLRPSGGLVYHWRAWKNRALWQPFRHDISRWLDQWNPKSQELLLIGPSGGYTLPSQWLLRFKKITAFDLDSSAQFFFRRQHPDLAIRFHQEDLFADFSLKAFEQKLDEHPSCAVLFSNVLGQLPLEIKTNESEWTDFLNELFAALETREWASYHDSYTLEPLPLAQHQQILERYVAGEDWLSHSPSRVEVIDHMTVITNKAARLSRARFGWSLTSNSLHLIEAIRPEN